jgi:hypothetical protein
MVEENKRVSRTQGLRSSGAAGPHRDKRTKRVTKKTIVDKAKEEEE